MQAQQNETVSVVLPGRLYKAHKPCTRENDHALIQPRPQGFSLKKWVGREKALASAGHVSPRTP